VAGKGKPLVAWKKVTMPKDKGGLGLKNMKLMNEALLIKHLHKFYNKEDIPWVQLIWHTLCISSHPSCGSRKRLFLVQRCNEICGTFQRGGISFYRFR
jgi:hypothetical protein